MMKTIRLIVADAGDPQVKKLCAQLRDELTKIEGLADQGEWFKAATPMNWMDQKIKDLRRVLETNYKASKQ